MRIFLILCFANTDKMCNFAPVNNATVAQLVRAVVS